jgi:hypothetical protein
MAIGGLESILKFSVITSFPFCFNLFDCLISLLEEDFENIIPRYKELNAIQILYPMLISNGKVVSKKVAGLISMIGE